MTERRKNADREESGLAVELGACLWVLLLVSMFTGMIGICSIKTISEMQVRQDFSRHMIMTDYNICHQRTIV